MQLKNPDVAMGIRNRMRIDKTMNKLVEINKPHARKPVKKNIAKKSDSKKAKKWQWIPPAASWRYFIAVDCLLDANGRHIRNDNK